MVKVKICGFTNPDDVKAACELGADMIGVILVPKSSRYVGVDKAREILAATSGGAAKVAVIMPRDLDELRKFAQELKPDYLQLHLIFPASDLSKLKGQLDVGLIVVVPIPQKVENHREIVDKAFEAAAVADSVLLDTKGPTGGGTGLTHDWSLSANIREAVEKPVFLAGGLNPSNVSQAIKTVRPYGVDVATGVESAPGKKDAKLISEFMDQARRVQ